METLPDYIDITILKTLKPLCHLTEDELSILAAQGEIQHADIPCCHRSDDAGFFSNEFSRESQNNLGKYFSKDSSSHRLSHGV